MDSDLVLPPLKIELQWFSPAEEGNGNVLAHLSAIRALKMLEKSGVGWVSWVINVGFWLWEFRLFILLREAGRLRSARSRWNSAYSSKIDEGGWREKNRIFPVYDKCGDLVSYCTVPQYIIQKERRMLHGAKLPSLNFPTRHFTFLFGKV